MLIRILLYNFHFRVDKPDSELRFVNFVKIEGNEGKIRFSHAIIIVMIGMIFSLI
jgi:hypothetical protein